MARDQGVQQLGAVTLRTFDGGDVFKKIGALGTISGVSRIVRITGSDEARPGAGMELTYSGVLDEAKPVREFLEPQLRAAKETQLDGEFVRDGDAPKEPAAGADSAAMAPHGSESA